MHHRRGLGAKRTLTSVTADRERSALVDFLGLSLRFLSCSLVSSRVCGCSYVPSSIVRMFCKEREKKVKETYSTGGSPVIPHQTTNPARGRLTSEFGMGSGARVSDMAVRGREVGGGHYVGTSCDGQRQNWAPHTCSRSAISSWPDYRGRSPPRFPCRGGGRSEKPPKGATEALLKPSIANSRCWMDRTAAPHIGRRRTRR